MSVVISVNQKPLSITPSNGEHIWTLSSLSAQTLPDFKYLVDIYFRPSSLVLSASTPTARLKVRPNTYGKAIIELEEVVRTFLKANPRFSGTTYPFLNYVADENSVVTLSDAQQTITYNGYNLWAGGSPNANVPQLWHMEQYQVVLGCEYLSGSSIVTEMDYDALWQPAPINIFPGVDNKLIPEPFLSGATLGYGYNQSSNFFQVDNQSWYYYDLFRHIYRTGDDNDCQPREFLNAAGRLYSTISQPDVVSRRVRRRLHHPQCPIIVSFLDGWNDLFYNFTTAVIVRSALSYSDDYTYAAIIQNSSLINNNWDIWKMGVFYLPYNNTLTGLNVIPTNSKKVAFYLNGGVYCMRYYIDPPFPSNGDFDVDDWEANPAFISVNATDSNGTDNSAFWENSGNGTIITIQSPQGTIVFQMNSTPIDMGDKYEFYAIRLDDLGTPFTPFYAQVCGSNPNGNDSIINADFSGRTSEILEFYMQEPDCINNPIHILFLNGRGQWDTYTFGKKSTKIYEIDRKTYRQESSLDKQFYSRGSYQRGTNIYESDATYRVECSSWYMDQNDVEIVEEIFLSSEVYMIEGTVIDPNLCNPPIDCQSCLEEIRLYQHLIPVVLRDKELKKYQKQYDKLFQYTFTLEYANVKRFRTQG
jgi:hypothetical protein